jgi:hypothetical protein
MPVLFVAGGTISGLYTLGVILIGTDFRGSRLAIVSTGFAMAYAAGSIVGSTPVGYLIDLFGPEALPVTIAICFLGLTVFLVFRRSPQAATQSEETTAVSVFDDLPEIKFDLSFLDRRPSSAATSALPDLDAVFRERAAAVARRATERELAGTLAAALSA